MYAERLKQVRKLNKLTIDEMAEKLGIKPRTYAAYERRENMPPLEIGTLLCTKFNVSGDWFLCGKGEMFITAPQNTQDKKELAKLIKETVTEMVLEYGGQELFEKIFKQP